MRAKTEHFSRFARKNRPEYGEARRPFPLSKIREGCKN
jgi:hypothetical protein